MKVSNKQLHVLLRVLQGSITDHAFNEGARFGINQQSRAQLYSEIMNQQSQRLIEVKD